MSLDASRWAWMQRIPKNDSASQSAIKIVLLSMADRADEDNICFPSIKRLEADTELNRKTIIAAIGWLKKTKLVEDTGQRRGRTGQVIVYRLLGVDNREITVFNNSPESGTVPETEPLKASKTGNSTENGTLTDEPTPEPTDDEASKEYRKRNSTENGTVPNTDLKSPENGMGKESQIRDTEPTSLEPTKEPCAKASHCASAGDAQERLVGKSGKQLNRTEAPLFLELWNAYNFKKDRAKAIDAFKRIIVPMFSSDPARNRKTLAKLLASIRTTVSSRDPNITPLYFERWITNRRWEDEDKPASSHSQDQSAVPVWKAKGFTSFEAFTEFNNQYATYTVLKAIKEKTPDQAQQFEHVRNYLNKNRPVTREQVTA